MCVVCACVCVFGCDARRRLCGAVANERRQRAGGHTCVYVCACVSVCVCVCERPCVCLETRHPSLSFLSFIRHPRSPVVPSLSLCRSPPVGRRTCCCCCCRCGQRQLPSVAVRPALCPLPQRHLLSRALPPPLDRFATVSSLSSFFTVSRRRRGEILSGMQSSRKETIEREESVSLTQSQPRFALGLCAPPPSVVSAARVRYSHCSPALCGLFASLQWAG